MKQVFEKKNVPALVIGIICILQLAVSFFYGSQKSFLTNDELFAYGKANNSSEILMDIQLNEWLDESDFLDYVTPGTNAFCYDVPYQNQIGGASPVLYFMLLHTASSLCSNEFSFWAGIGINMILLLGCTLVLYFLSKELFSDNVCALLICGCFSSTYGALNTMLYIQVYMMLALIFLLHMLVYAKYCEQSEVKIKGYFFLGMTLVIGNLIHYYFMFFAALLTFWYIIKWVYSKKWKTIRDYLVTVGASLLISLRLFPDMWNQIYYGSLKTQVQNVLLYFNMKEYLKKLYQMFGFINKQVFQGFLWLILPILFVLLLIYAIRNKGEAWKELEKVFPVIFVTMGYFFLVALIVPDPVDYHMMPLYPVVFLLAIGLLYWLIKNISKKIMIGKHITVIISLTICFFICIPTMRGIVPYYSFWENRQHVELMHQYADRKAVYIDREFCWEEYYDIVQLMKEVDEYYMISYAQIVQWEIDAALEETADDDEIIVIVGNSALDDEITAYIQETVQAEKMVFLDQYKRWTIYRAMR